MSATAHETARIYRLTVAAYRRMGEVGILGPELRTELIDGKIVEMTPIGPTHGGTVNYLSNRLKEAVGSEVIVSVQNPVELNVHSEPQPDIMLLRSRGDYYRRRTPTARGCVTGHRSRGHHLALRPRRQAAFVCEGGDPGGLAGGSERARFERVSRSECRRV